MTASGALGMNALRAHLLLKPGDSAAWEELSMKSLLEGDSEKSAFATAIASQLQNRQDAEVAIDPPAALHEDAMIAEQHHDVIADTDYSNDSGFYDLFETPIEEVTLSHVARFAAEKLGATKENYLILTVASGVITIASRGSASENAALFMNEQQTHVQIREQLIYRDPETGVRIANLSMAPLKLSALAECTSAAYVFFFQGQYRPLVEELPKIKQPLRIQLEGWNGDRLRGWAVFNGNDIVPRVPILIAILDGKPLQAIEPWISRHDVMQAVGSSHKVKAGFEINSLFLHLAKEGSSLKLCDPITLESQGCFLLSRYRTFHEQIRDISRGFCGFGVQERQGEVVVTSLPRLTDQHPPIVLLSSKLDILVPVYRNMSLTESCMRALRSAVLHAKQAYSTREIYIHATNDCSPELEVNERLPALCEELGIILHINSENLGFIHTVNNFMRGTDDDILLVNSDVIVSQNCILEFLSTRDAHGSQLGSITTFSNNATIFSYPWNVTENGLSSSAAIERISRAFSKVSKESSICSIQTPVSHGYLMYLSRTAIREVGYFDEYFGLGYGEEVDWAVRAAMNGFEHYLCTSTFAFHKGSVSFGATTRLRAVENSNQIISERYPFYDRMVQEFIAVDELRQIRNSVGVALLLESIKPFALHISHNSGGGIDKYIDDLTQTSEGFTHLILRSGRTYQDLASGQVAAKAFEFSVECKELDVVILGDLESTIIPALMKLDRNDYMAMIHSFVGWNPEEISILMDYINAYCSHYDMVGHDYMALCPRIKLIDSTGQYCGVGDIQKCSHCLRTGEPSVESMLLAPYTSDIKLYRGFFADILNDAQTIHVSTAEQSHLFDSQGFHNCVVTEPVEPPYSLLQINVIDQESKNFVIIGGISFEKGAERLFRIASLTMHIDPSAHFYLIGAASNVDKLSSLPNFTHIGRYSSFHQLRESILSIYSPIAFFPTIWPETWCYTLSEAMQLGLPVIGPNLGAIGSRLSGIRSNLVKIYDPELDDYEVARIVCSGIELTV